MHLVFERADGTATAIQVNSLSTVHVQTWTPPVFGEGGVAPTLVEDQTIALNDVTSIRLADDAGGARVLATPLLPVSITRGEAEALEAQWETAPPITANAPWDEA